VSEGFTGDGGELSAEMLSGYLDHELDERVVAAVEARLADSPEWRAELEEVRVARLAVRSLPTREPPAGFWDSVSAAVGADGEREPVGNVVPLRSSRSHRRVAWIASAAAAVALVVAVVVVPHRPEVTPNVTAVVTQHGAQSSDAGDPISTLAPVGPLAGFRR
jgi:anti-sigma factor RsiW